jgi:hypothetical protein
MGFPPRHETVQLPVSQITLQALAAAQSTAHAPVHSMAHALALLQSTVAPGPTTAAHEPLIELQSRWQPAPQLAPHVAAELQSTLQVSRHAAVHDAVLLLQSTAHDEVAPQSTAHAEPLLH